MVLVAIISTPAHGQLPPEFEVRPQDGWRWATLRDRGEPPPELVEFVGATFADVRARLGVNGPKDPLIIRAPDRSWFVRVTQSFGGSKPHEWAAALAFPSKGVIVLNARMQSANPHEFRITVAHEIVHVVIGVGLGYLPRWYHEGLAQEFSGDRLEPEASDLIAGWAHQGEILPLAKLDRYLNRNHQRASVFYRQSLSFVRFVSRHHGESVHGEVVRRVAKGEPFVKAFRAATGEELVEVEARWHDWLASQFSLLRWMFGLLRPFSGLALICAVGYWYQRRRRRRQLQRMKEAEEGEPAAEEEFWRREA